MMSMKRLVTLAALTALVGGLAPHPAFAQPHRPPPPLKELLGGNIVAMIRLRWSKVIEGQRVVITIQGGAAERRDPRWAQQPSRLPFNLDDNLRLGQALKQARLLALKPAAAPSTAPQDRTLELLAQGSDGWAIVGAWAQPKERWRKQQPALYQLLEPLFTAPAETFTPIQP